MNIEKEINDNVYDSAWSSVGGPASTGWKIVRDSVLDSVYDSVGDSIGFSIQESVDNVINEYEY